MSPHRQFPAVQALTGAMYRLEVFLGSGEAVTNSDGRILATSPSGDRHGRAQARRPGVLTSFPLCRRLGKALGPVRKPRPWRQVTRRLRRVHRRSGPHRSHVLAEVDVAHLDNAARPLSPAARGSILSLRLEQCLFLWKHRPN
jgi:hypothetical protein